MIIPTPGNGAYTFSYKTFLTYFLYQDLLSIANVAEQHEVWDFLSASSKVCIIAFAYVLNALVTLASLLIFVFLIQ